VSFAAITLCVASQRVFSVVSIYFVVDSVRKLLDTPSYMLECTWQQLNFGLDTRRTIDRAHSEIRKHLLVAFCFVVLSYRVI